MKDIIWTSHFSEGIQKLCQWQPSNISRSIHANLHGYYSQGIGAAWTKRSPPGLFERTLIPNQHKTNDDLQEDRDLEQPQADEVQININATGLCGSDLHYYNHFRNGDILVREPLSLGHESAGTVTAIGANVTELAVGDHVALEVGVPCEQCRRCKEGRYNICEHLRFRSSGKSFPHYQGTLQDRINHHAKWCHKLPQDVSLEMGALLEPLSVALHAYKRSQAPADANVLVFGAGAVGLLCAAVAKLRGAKVVVIADIDEGRLAFAVENHFADQSYLVSTKRGQSIDEELEIAREVAREVCAAGGIAGYDIVFECTGVPSCVQAGIYVSISC